MTDAPQTTALDHLGDVLQMLASLCPGDRCQAFADALSFYNEARPQARVEPMEGYVTRIVHFGPLDWLSAAAYGAWTDREIEGKARELNDILGRIESLKRGAGRD